MKSDLGVPSVFDSFNARNLDPQQVARRFIPPSHFRNLIMRRHSLIVGPRGSGKTTLLKMLQLPALLSWSHPSAEEYRSSIDFVGVFIPADVSWGAQLSSLAARQGSESLQETFSLAAFTTHILIALVDAIAECTDVRLQQSDALSRFYVNLSRPDETALVKQIAHTWLLEPLIPSLHGLRLSLRDRLSKISAVARRASLTSSDDAKSLVLSTDFLHLGFLETAIFAVDAFNAVAGDRNRKWGLLFDELEIAPASIRKALFAALRSADSRILLKLSLSPYHEDVDILQTSISAMSGEDYQAICLWYGRKEDGFKFSRELLSSMLQDLGCEPVDPNSIFGVSDFDAEVSGDGIKKSSYRPGGRNYKRFISLASKDPSFRKYLATNAIDLREMHGLTETKRAGLVRKITSIVAVRDAFRSELVSVGDGVRNRSRKNPTLYTGASSLLSIVEGNPRWIIGLLGPLLRQYKDGEKAVPNNVQAKSISAASSRFRALLKTIPFSPGQNALRRLASGARGLLTLLDAIGEAFEENVVTKDFVAEPVLSFVVDANTDSELLTAVGRALNAGALIHVPDDVSETILSSMRGKRFRLSFMLATQYGIPLTLGRAASLNQILSNEKVPGQLDWLGQS